MEKAVEMQVSNHSPKGSKSKVEAQKELVESLKVQWKLLWSERFSDKVRAEDVSVNNYVTLHIERGTIIHATRAAKALNFKEILNQHLIENPDRYIQPDFEEGGWKKFVKTNITNRTPDRKIKALSCTPKKPSVNQNKKGRRGWLHTV